MSDAALEKEADLQCPGCQGVPYRLYRRKRLKEDGSAYESWEYVLWPTSPDIPPPKDPKHIQCPECGLDCKRTA